jgi:hypothetical protein
MAASLAQRSSQPELVSGSHRKGNGLTDVMPKQVRHDGWCKITSKNIGGTVLSPKVFHFVSPVFSTN